VIRAGATRRFPGVHTTGGIAAPVNTAIPVITGTEVEGQTLTCSTGTWTGTGITYTYQWERGGSPIGGATNSTYLLQAADVGNTLTCVVTATNGGGFASSESNPTGTIAAANPVVASLEFDGSTDYLSMSNADWGSYDRAKFTIIGSFYRETGGVEQTLIARDNSASGSSYEFNLYLGSTNNVGFNSNNGNNFWFSAGSAVSTNTWTAFMLHFDSAAASNADRVKVWLNGSPLSPSGFDTVAAVPSGGVDTAIGARNWTSAPSRFDGLLYSMAFVSGANPDPADVFDGSAGKLKDLSAIPGLKSLLTGSSAVDDFLLADWTNNGTVTTSPTVP